MEHWKWLLGPVAPAIVAWLQRQRISDLPKLWRRLKRQRRSLDSLQRELDRTRQQLTDCQYNKAQVEANLEITRTIAHNQSQAMETLLQQGQTMAQLIKTGVHLSEDRMTLSSGLTNSPESLPGSSPTSKN